MAKVTITYEYIQKAMQSSVVRKALEARANGIASRARGIASSENVDMEVSVSSGTRPKGRPYSRVVTDNVDQEWGTSVMGRRRTLGRAAGGK